MRRGLGYSRHRSLATPPEDAIATGATGGIGERIAGCFTEGARVVAAGPELLDIVRREYRAARTG